LKLESKIAPHKDVERIILDDEIYDRITHDDCPPKERFVLPKNGYIAIGGYLDGKIASLYMVHGSKMHFMVLKCYRKYSRQLLDSAMNFYSLPVYCEIPTLYRSVINFAKKAGFVLSEIKEKSYLKNGKLYNVEVLKWDS